MCEPRSRKNIIELMGKQPVKVTRNVQRKITQAFAQKEVKKRQPR